MTERLARASSRRPWLVVGLWSVVILTAVVLASLPAVAVALLIDATIVRSVLVPAAMKLLGRRNWYLRSWLSWLPDVHVEGQEPPSSAAPRPQPSGS